MIRRGNASDSPGDPGHLNGGGTADAGGAGRVPQERGAESRARPDRAGGSGGSGISRHARDVGCTPGTASKWRVRFARDRLAGLRARGEINESSMRKESSLGLAFWHTSGVVISPQVLSLAFRNSGGEAQSLEDSVQQGGRNFHGFAG